MIGRASLLAVLAALALGAAAPALAAKYRVAATTTVSGPTTLPDQCQAKHSESQPQLAVHPDAPRQLSAVYLQDGTAAAVGAGSRDAGRTWTRTPMPEATACSGGAPERAATVNPLIAAGPGGRAWYGNSWIGGGAEFAYGVLAHAGTGGGASWGPGVDPYGGYAQNLALAGDPSAAETVRAVWTNYDQVPNPLTYLPAGSYALAATSTDGGKTFSQPVVAGDAGLDRFVVNVRLSRASDGALVLVFDSAAAEDLPGGATGTETRFMAHAARSEDGGETWSPPVDAGAPVFKLVPDPEGQDPPNAPAGTVAVSAKFDLATGPGGRAVIAWADQREDGGWVIRMTGSGDGGRQWSEPFDALSLPAPAFMPAVAFDSKGALGLFWYDWTRDETGDEPLTTTPWFAVSEDGGRSWLKTALGKGFDLRAAYEDGVDYDGTAIGVYQDLVPLGDGFGAMYTVGPPLAADGRTDVLFSRVEPDRGKPRLKLRVRPRSAFVGRPVRVRFTVRAAGRPVRRARVRVAGRTVRTNRRGRASLRFTFRRSRSLTVRASRRGYRPASARLWVWPRRPARQGSS